MIDYCPARETGTQGSSHVGNKATMFIVIATFLLQPDEVSESIDQKLTLSVPVAAKTGYANLLMYSVSYEFLFFKPLRMQVGLKVIKHF